MNWFRFLICLAVGHTVGASSLKYSESGYWSADGCRWFPRPGRYWIARCQRCGKRNAPVGYTL